MNDVADIPRCADCTSYPLSFCDQERFCRTVMKTVSFMRPACDKQSERARGWSANVELLKVQVRRRRVNLLGMRMESALTRAHELDKQRQVDLAERQMVEAFRAGQSGDILHKEWGGVVYFVRCGEFMKIGHTAHSIKKRFDGLMNGNPYELDLIGLVRGTVQLERRFHAHLKEHHHRLEWFRIDLRFMRRARLLITRNGGHFFGQHLF